MLDGPVSDSVEAASLTLRQDYIDIYSASWGPGNFFVSILNVWRQIQILLVIEIDRCKQFRNSNLLIFVYN
jgi:hypothetical protein